MLLPAPSSSSTSPAGPSGSGGRHSKPIAAASGPARKKESSTSSSSPDLEKWRSELQERIYSRRLAEALRSGGTTTADPRSVKDAADSALAVTARGRSRWSRAILRCRRRRRKLLLVKAGGKIRGPRRLPPPPSKEEDAAAKGEGKVKDRLRTLGRLVPGCRKLSAPGLLTEAADYVAALEMQVRAMRALADALSGMSIAAAAAPDPDG